ncbi:YceI family protein [Polaribacter sp. Hel1_85]|nr:YceI family protein [Polaribacter sp. Hel1_85]
MFILVFSVTTCFTQELVQNDLETSINFKIKNFGINVAGVFNVYEFSSNFDAANLKDSFMNAIISVKSITTNTNAIDKHLLKSDFFDVENHPKIIYKSTEIEKKDGSKYIIKGFLNIKGIKKRIETPIEIKEKGGKFVFSANFTLNRKDFDVGGSSLVLSKKVNVKMKYVANRNQKRAF